MVALLAQQPALSFLAPQELQCLVDRNPVKLGVDARRAVELAYGPEGTDVGVLRRIGRIVVIAEHAEQNAVHAIARARIKFTLRLTVSSTASVDDLVLGHDPPTSAGPEPFGQSTSPLLWLEDYHRCVARERCGAGRGGSDSAR